MGEYYWEQNPVFKAKLKETALQKLPFYLDKFEAQVKNNDGHFINGKVMIDYMSNYRVTPANTPRWDLHRRS